MHPYPAWAQGVFGSNAAWREFRGLLAMATASFAVPVDLDEHAGVAWAHFPNQRVKLDLVNVAEQYVMHDRNAEVVQSWAQHVRAASAAMTIPRPGRTRSSSCACSFAPRSPSSVARSRTGCGSYR
jgi:hypothetical protein